MFAFPLCRMPLSARPGAGLHVAISAAALLGSVPAVALATSGNPFAAFHGMETLEEKEETIHSLRIPVQFRLRDWEGRSYGLRLRLAGSFAIADLENLLSGRVELDLEQIRAFSLVPGLEGIFPVGSLHKLRPHVDLGAGVDNASESVSYLGAVGLRTEFIFLWRSTIFGLEPGFRWSGNWPERFRDNSAFHPFVTVSARRVLDWRIGGRRPDLGPYVDGGYDFQALEYSSLTATGSESTPHVELGLGLGFSMGRPRFGPFPVPRLRVGYRVGELEGIRVQIGGDWVTTVPEI